MGKQIDDDLFFFSFLTWVRPRFDILSSKNKPDKVRKTEIHFSSDIFTSMAKVFHYRKKAAAVNVALINNFYSQIVPF